jgi:predicted AAA+ superfamily ATPase
MKYVPRRLAERLAQLLRTFPAVLVYGPRQCGKSTLVRRRYPDWHHVDLERPTDRDALAADIEGFFDRHPRRVVIDEAQRLPELLPVLRHVIDRRATKGRFLLLGSTSPDLVRATSETLAGRLGHLELTPLRAPELAGSRHAPGRWFWGGYPGVHALPTGARRLDWLDSYVSTFLERDLPTLGLRLPAPRLRILWTMLTHVHGNLLNMSDLARSLGVSVPTVGSHLDVLESTFMIRRLPPFFANVHKRLTKSPKLYIRDTGLLHFLAGLRQPRELDTWPRRGASFEGLVIEELAALAAERLVRPEVFFWRTHAGAEVDLLITSGQKILPIEIKSAAAVGHYDVAGLRQCMKDLSLKRGWVVCSATERRTIGRNIEVIPWAAVARGEVDLGLR